MDHFSGNHEERMQCRGVLHIVKKGDTLYKIAKKHNAALSKVMYANPYVDVYNLQEGDEICVPVMEPHPPVHGHPGGMRTPGHVPDGKIKQEAAMPWNYQQSDQQMLEDYLQQNPH